MSYPYSTPFSKIHMSACDCPGTQIIRDEVLGGSAVFATEGQASVAANGFADLAERLARRRAKAAKRDAECKPGPQGQLCLSKVSDVVLEKWTAVGAIRTPPAPYNGWLARGGCKWSVKIECEIIDLAALEKEGPPRRRGTAKRRQGSRRG